MLLATEISTVGVIVSCVMLAGAVAMCLYAKDKSDA